MNSVSQFQTKTAPLLVAFALACFTLSPPARAQLCRSGCVSGFNTVLGEDAFLNNTGANNTAIGAHALESNTTSSNNTAIGCDALFSNTTGNGTAIGMLALYSNTTGYSNTATGNSALYTNTTGFQNTANGYQALIFNTIGSYNTATGAYSLVQNTIGTNNTANGAGALGNTRTGSNNTAIGMEALDGLNDADNNTAAGFQALLSNWTGTGNTGTGSTALLTNVTGDFNTATGYSALYSNTHGSSNTATGTSALFFNTTGHDNTAEGSLALAYNTIGSSNIALGSNAGRNLTTGSNNIDIGANVLGNAADANTIRIGKPGTQQKTFIAGIYGKTVNGGVGVFINSNGQLGTVQSSARYKQDINPMDKASEAIFALKPVTFRYKKEIDPEATPQFGLVAEDVEKVDPDLVVRDSNGKPDTVRYDTVNAMLLNEFLKDHKKVQQLEVAIAQQRNDFDATIAELKKEIASIVARSKGEDKEIRTVTSEIGLNNMATQVVVTKR